MSALFRLLLVVVVVETLACGYVLVQRMLRVEPALPPAAVIDDPLYRRDLQALADDAAANNSARSWNSLAEALLGHGFYAEAEQSYRRVLELQPQNQAAQFGLALCLDRTGRVEEAIPEYRRAAELPTASGGKFTGPPYARYAIGMGYLKLEDAAQAERAFRAIEGFAPADYQLAKLLVRSGRHDEAAPMIAARLQELPDSLLFTYLKLRSLDARGEEDAAFEASLELQRARQFVSLNFNTDFIGPMNVRHGLNAENEAYNELLKTGDLDAVAAKLREVLAVAAELRLPHRALLWTRLAEVELQRQRPEAMQEALKQLRSLGVANAETLQLEGAALSLLGDEERAVELWLRAARMSPNVPLHLRLAEHYDREGDASRRDDHRGEAALLNAKSFYRANQFPEARGAIEEAIQFSPESAQAWFYRGEIERQSGDPAEALDSYRKCLELDPNHGRARRIMNQAVLQPPPANAA